MKRRAFLQALAAVPAASLLPGAPPPPGFTKGALVTLKNRLWLESAGEVSYMAVMHPDTWFDLRRLVARDYWLWAYSEWRKFRAAGAQPCTYEELMLAVKEKTQGGDALLLRESLEKAMVKGEFYRYENVRFITSEKVADFPVASKTWYDGEKMHLNFISRRDFYRGD